jgi:hypothetical protein
MAISHYTMHGRSRFVLQDAGGVELTRMSVTEDLGYFYFGVPVRLTGLLTPRLAVYGQFDLNMQPLIAELTEERAHAQMVRGGVQLWLPNSYVNAELSMDGFRPGSATLTAEVGIAF